MLTKKLRVGIYPFNISPSPHLTINDERQLIKQYSREKDKNINCIEIDLFIVLENVLL